MNDIQRHLIETRQVKVTVTKPVVDNRYRCLVTLVKSDRPRYWNFLCSNCGRKIVELQNLEVYLLDDFYDPQNINNTGIGRHCKGITSNGLPCHYTYFFHVS